jgi:hypothetical protein
MKAAESMAIKFALDRYQRGDVKVNAVHDMMEHMSRQMDTLRQILRVQEDKMSKAGILVESHADILDRMFWAEIPEAARKAFCSPAKPPACRPATFASSSKFFSIATTTSSPPKFSPTTAAASTPKMPIPAARPPSASLNSPTCYATAPDEVMPNALAMIGEN